MALKYANVGFVDAVKIAEIAKIWLSTAEDFSSAGKGYAANVHKAVKDGSWDGITAVAAESVYSTTRKHLSGAQAEARAVGKILQEGSQKIRSLQKDLQDKESQIRRDDLHVSADGVVWSSNSAVHGTEELNDLSNAEQREKEQVISNIQSTIKKRQRELDAIVAQFDGIDSAMSLALHKAMNLSNESDSFYNPQFNDKANADLESVRADRVEAITTKLNSSEGLTPAEREELRVILNESTKDKGLAKKILDRVGADEFIKLAASIEGEKKSATKNEKGSYSDIEKSLAKTLAKASKHDEFSPKKWVEEFDKYGRKNYEWPISDEHQIEVKGYQSLLTLMEKSSGYSKDFAKGLSDKIIDAEKDDSGIWKADGPLNKSANVVADPLDTILGVMSRTPSLATEYLNDEEKLKYIDSDRDWEIMKDFVGTGNNSGDRQSGTFEYEEAENSREGFGKALEAAATGRLPGENPTDVPDHKGDRGDLFEKIVQHYGSGEFDIHENLRSSVAHVVADYPEDVREIVKRPGEGTGETAKNRVEVEGVALRAMMTEVSEDPAAYGKIHASQLLESARSLEESGNPEELKGIAEYNGEAMGILSGMREEAISKRQEEGISEVEWNRVATYHGIGSVITAIPGLGDVSQRVLDTVLGVQEGSRVEEVQNKYDTEKADEYLKTQENLRRMLVEYAIDADVIGGVEESEGKSAEKSLIGDLTRAQRTEFEVGRKFYHESKSASSDDESSKYE